MKLMLGVIALLFATTAALAQSPPKAAKKPLPVQLKPQAPMGCKLVGTVRGTKIWAGDCIAAEPAAETPQAAPPPPAMPPAEKQ